MKKWLSDIKRLIVVVLLLIVQYAPAQSFTLKGLITGKDTGTAVLIYINANNKKCSDTTAIQQGKFEFNGTVNGASYAYINTDPYSVTGDNSYDKFDRKLFIEPNVITMVFQSGAIGKAKITGTSTQKKYDDLHGQQRKAVAQLQPLLSAQDSIRKLLKDGSISGQEADQRMKEVQKRMAPIYASITSTELSYIRQYPEEYLSLSLLQRAIGRIPEERVDSLYNELSNAVKTSSLGYDFIQYYARYKRAIGNDFPFDNIQLNELAPSFSVYTTATDSITLSAFRGSVILLEFWELTCFPCLQANPQFEIIRRQYSDKEFKVIAINSTATAELSKLRSYITKNQLSNWMHVVINKDGNPISNDLPYGDFSHYYKIGVPRTILIDKSGKVIYKRDDYTPEEIKEIAQLVNKAVSEN